MARDIRRSVRPRRRPGTAALLEPLEPRRLLAVIRWDGGGGDGQYTNPLNWAGDVLPGPTDRAIINVPGQTITVEFNDPGQHNVYELYCEENLTIAAGTLLPFFQTFMNGTLAITGGKLLVGILWKQNGPLALSGGSIDGIGTWVLQGTGSWTGGSLGDLANPNGRFQVTGTLDIDGDVTLKRALVNAGTINWIGGTISVGRGTIHNLAGRTLSLPADATIANIQEPAGAIVNRGTIVATGGVTTIGVRFYQPAGGTLDVQAGTLRLRRSGRIDGTFSMAPGTVLEYAGDTLQVGLVVAPGATLTPAATVRVERGNLGLHHAGLAIPTVEVSGGRLLFSAGASLGQVTLSGGTLGGTADITITGALAWTGGGVGAPAGSGARLIIPAGVGATIDAGSNRADIARDVENAGTIEWLTGDIGLFATLTNGAGGVFEIAADGDVGVSHTRSGAIVNEGMVRKTGPGTAGLLRSLLDRPFTNSGTVAVDEGVLAIGGGSGAGAFTLGPGATLRFGRRGFGLDPGGSIVGEGTLAFTEDGFIAGTALPSEVRGTVDVALLSIGNNVDLDGATLMVDAWELLPEGILYGNQALAIDGPFAWSGGRLDGSGECAIAPGATMTIAGQAGVVQTLSRPLRNHGTIVLASGSLQVGIAMVNDSDGVFRLESGVLTIAGNGSLDNRGRLEKVGPEPVILSAEATLDGEVHVLVGALTVLGGAHGAAFTVAANALLRIGGSGAVGAVLTSASGITGAGEAELGGGSPVLPASIAGSIDVARVRIVGPVSLAGATLAPGELVLATGAQIVDTPTLAIDFPLSWEGGMIDAGVVATVSAGTTLTIASVGTIVLWGSLVNHGTIAFQSGWLLTVVNGRLTNAPGGVIAAEAGEISGVGSLVNEGVVVKSGPGTFSVGEGSAVGGVSTGVRLDGAAQVQGGTLTLARGTHGVAATVSAGATLELRGEGGAAALSSASSVTGAGTLAATMGAVTIAGVVDIGAMEVSDASAGAAPPDLLLSGPPKTAGALTLDAGTLRLGVGLVLSVTGDYGQSGGTLVSRIGGTGQNGRLAVAGAATLGAASALSFEYMGAFTPVANQQFDLVTFGTLAGQFGTIIIPAQPPGLIADIDYVPGIVRLRIVPV